MENHKEKNDFPQYYSSSKRGEIRRGTLLLTTEERNKLLLKKCTKIDFLMKKYSAGHRGYALCLVRDEVNYIKRIRGIENVFIENQILRLIFELNLIDKEQAYLGDLRGFKSALKAVKTILTLIIEELNSEIQSSSGDIHGK